MMYMEITLDGDGDIAIDIGHGLKPETYMKVRINGDSDEEIYHKAIEFMRTIKAKAYYDSKNECAKHFCNYLKNHTIRALQDRRIEFAMGGNQVIEFELLPKINNYDLVL